MKANLISLTLFFLLSSTVLAMENQARYNYHIDLNALEKDRFQVELFCEDFGQDTLVYHFPWMIPGTYLVANYGKFIHKLKAFDQDDQAIKVKKKGKNTFIITPAENIKTIKYWEGRQ